MDATPKRFVDQREDEAEDALRAFMSILIARKGERERVDRILRHIDRIVDLDRIRDVVVVGCGPLPELISILHDRGMRATGVEPEQLFVEEGNRYLAGKGVVLVGCAEELPVPEASADLIFLENVLEHVESPRLCLSQMYRALRPGGLLFVTTTNRTHVSVLGRTGEFSVPFFNWLPGLVQECYVHAQLHFRPELANMTSRPAVHWFSYLDLCRAGRDAGFARFFSTLDTRSLNDDRVTANPIKRVIQRSSGLLRLVQHNPWLRALALTQIGQDCMMWKRS